jgi:hemimethylated DNA binding protein
MLATRNNIRKSLQLHQRFSTSASSNKSKKSSLEKQQILSKTLYKQILKWTARTGNVPFDPIPPLTLIPPRVDPIALETLANVLSKGNSDDEKGKETTVTSSSSSSNLSHLAKYLPSNSIIEANRLIIPISNAADVKRVTKLAYALNNHTLESKEDLEQIKERVSLGFDVLKSLNQLGAVLERRKAARVEHEDREGVTFHVGQVVQHKTERWRAIVSGWSKLKDKEVEKSTKTSLTNKEYDVDVNANESGEEGEETGLLTSAQEVQYVVHLDEGDAAQSRVRILGSMKVKQNELEAVTDDDLKKIRNSLLKHYFHSFDSRKGEFVPGEIMNFEYPMDSSPSSNNANDILEESKYTIAKHENSKVVLLGVREMASKLHRIIMDTTSCAEARNFAILSGVEKQLRAIITGEFEENIADQITPQTTSSHKLAIKHLHALLNVSLEVHTTLWQRKTAEENKDRIHFPLGSIVKHKKYGFRGVVVTWDPYPKADVSRWDGLQDIEGDVNKMPFYHVVPDLGDTVKAFGQERPFRYVCQENLEVCPESEQDIEVNLDEEWSSSSGEADFKPSDSLKFRHAETIGDDDNVIIACLNELQVCLCLRI